MTTDYYAMGAGYRANMTQPQRKAAWDAATNKGDDLRKPVQITVKDATQKDVALTLQQDQWIAFVAGFLPM